MTVLTHQGAEIHVMNQQHLTSQSSERKWAAFLKNVFLGVNRNQVVSSGTPENNVWETVG